VNRKAIYTLIGVAGGLLIACIALGVVVANAGGARLTSVDGLTFSSTACLGPKNLVRSGAQIKIATTWFAEQDLVSVLHDYSGRGYRPIDHISDSLELLPAEAQTFDLLVAQARMLRAVSLSYTPDLSTRIRAVTSLTVCPP